MTNATNKYSCVQWDRSTITWPLKKEHNTYGNTREREQTSNPETINDF